MFFKNLFPMFYHGPKKGRRRKLRIFLVVLFVSLLGFCLHVSSVWSKTKHSLSDTISTLFDDLGLNLLVGLALYLAFEIAFQNIDKKYGLLDEFSYPGFVDDMTNIQRKGEIKILSIFLKVFTRPLIEENETEEKHQERVRNFEHLKERFKTTISDLCKNNNKSDKRIKMSILLLDPISFSAKQRSKELLDAGLNIYIIGEIIETIKELIALSIEVVKGNVVHKNIKMLNVKIYDRTPPFSLFKVDDRYSFSFYPRNKTIVDADHLSFYEGTPFQKFVTSTFDEIWKEESTFDLEHYKYITIYSTDDSKPECPQEVYYVDYFQKKDAWFPEQKFIIIFPNQDQAKKINKYIDSGNNNRLVLDYRNKKKITGNLCIIRDNLSNLKISSEIEAMDCFRELAIDKYPANLIIGPMTRVGDSKLIVIENS